MEWKEGPVDGTIAVDGGTVIHEAIVKGSGTISQGSFAIDGRAARLTISVDLSSRAANKKPIVTVSTDNHPFSFFLLDVHEQYPIYIPAYGVMVTEQTDERSYEQIERDTHAQGLLNQLQKIEAEPEENFENAAACTRDLPAQTWLGLSRDIRIFGIGFRGVGGEELLWDWVQPRFHGFETALTELEDQAVRYRFMLGRGIGCVENISRRLEEGVLPILHSTIVDDDITYRTVSFASYESNPLNEQTLRGSHYLVADGYGFGHMLNEEQTAKREQLLPNELNPDEETVLYFRATATNTARVPRYAWFKNPVPNAIMMNNDKHYTFDNLSGFVQYSSDRVCCVSKLNGEPLTEEETAILILPGETAVFEFFLPHRPISHLRAERLIKQSFSSRLEECRSFWKGKLDRAARIRVPEQRLDEMIRAGLLHLDLVSYGIEPEGTIVPTIGVYTAIGSESAPIIQFMESMGGHDVAARSLQFFLDKQHEDGFIQNFGGYMLETGAALWSFGEHYRYTRDEVWLAQIKENLLKAYDYIVAWRERNRTEQLRGKGYGMLEGKTADPEDPFHSFMLNGYAYIGVSRLAEMLAASDPVKAAQIGEFAEELKTNIREGFHQAMALSPVVPLADGTWVPTAPPWVEHRGPLSLYAESAKWLTHGSVVARDSLLGPLYLVFQEVLQADEQSAQFLLQFHNELMCMRNVALSQPYYSIHPFVHLLRGEVKPFLKAYYNGFAGLADRETYTFWEHYWHASPHKTHEEGWFLLQTRWMLYMESGRTLNLLPGIPRAWLEHGKSIELNEVATYFGPISLHVESQLEKGVIIARISSSSDRKPDSLCLRIPHPEGRKPFGVTGGTYAAGRETVTVERFTGSAEITLHF
ncbi:hypothetical protein [Cohnella phaseoli]|uniref:Alpha-L-rhamnosidase six-hairpin glycosidase domain-containing protein n=1 Tax=Cohnella phaseoli TaxID=456490 RepID=A0A3D9I5S7_9BACL|nr:hypothetical protein [Cohnella phaseoli]RED56526.1 hypothetical protein DFP98_13984 [Cohnella phaseoli]